MICKIVINRIIALIFLSVISTANAGLISTANGSYIDDNTGLEWMDFSGTKGLSYNQVMRMISDGGLYEDWVTPTAAQVHTLYNGNFANDLAYIDSRGNLHRGRADNRTRDLNIRGRYTSMFDDLYDAMGLSLSDTNTYMLYEITPGTMGYIYQLNNFGHRTPDIVTFSGANSRFTGNSAFSRASTLLIKKGESFDAPEPSTLAILALGMIGLASRRFKK
jgi:hypothetical protein